MKKLFIIALMLCFSLTAYAEIRLGGLFAVSGPASFLGNPEKLTTEMLVEQINASGGINGEKIKLFIYDTQGREDRAITYFKQLATKDKVTAVIGPSRTGCALAIKNLASKYKVPMIACAASAKIVTPANPYVYKTPQSDIHVAEKLFDHAEDREMFVHYLKSTLPKKDHQKVNDLHRYLGYIDNCKDDNIKKLENLLRS